MTARRNDTTRKSRRVFLQATAAITTTALFGNLPFAALAQTAPPAKLKIGVIGSGRAGSALGGAWIRAGHEVMFSSLNLESDKKLAASLGPNAHAGTSREAVAFGSVLLVAVPYSAMPAVGKDVGDLVKGKIVIDASNPIVARDGEIAVAAREKGAGITSAEYLPGARMGEAATKKERIGMPMAGDDANAISVASALVRDVGYEPVLVGTLAAMSKYLVPGTPLGGERSPEEVRKVAATLK